MITKYCFLPILTVFLLLAACTPQDIRKADFQVEAGAELPASPHQLSIITPIVILKNNGSGTYSEGVLSVLLSDGVSESELASVSLEDLEAAPGESVSFPIKFIIPKNALGERDLHFQVTEESTITGPVIKPVDIQPCLTETEPNNSRYANANILLQNNGYQGDISTEFDVDWYKLTLAPGKSVGFLIDGETSWISIELYLNLEGDPFQNYVDDDFSYKLIIENTESYSTDMYIRINTDNYQ
ncbi:MAG: hypothetical protein KAU17_16090 [Spirochaetales bacterium]|nr:hypothetical protein [Spirochaetales bacterium]